MKAVTLRVHSFKGFNVGRMDVRAASDPRPKCKNVCHAVALLPYRSEPNSPPRPGRRISRGVRVGMSHRRQAINQKRRNVHQIGTTSAGRALSCHRVGGISPVKIFTALSRFVYRPEPPTPSTAPFDDGLVEIARLIAGEEPVRESAEARRSRSGP
jgi:hypothetical protein